MVRSRDITEDQAITIEELGGNEIIFEEAVLPPSGTEEVSLEFYERYSMTLEKLDQENEINISVSDFKVAE